MTSTAYATGASSRTYAFADPHLYGRALRGGEAEIVIAGKGEFRAALTAVDFERLWMQRADETAEKIAWARNAPSRSPILFLATMDQAPMIDCGLEVSPGDILFPSEGVPITCAPPATQVGGRCR